MSSGDTPYYLTSPPPIISFFNQQTFGPLEIDACGTTAVKCNGDILLDGVITNSELVSPPKLFFNGSVVNISGTATKVTGAMVFENDDESSIVPYPGIPHFEVQPTTSELEPGRLYWTSYLKAGGSTVKVLCIA